MTRWELNEITPDRPEDIPPRQELPQQQAAGLGFPSREPLERKKRAPKAGPSDQINIRAAITDINAFISWCERNRFSYREGFAELVKRLD